MKTLYSIGDSFMTVDDPDDGIIGFCELYCQQQQFKHISLARPGATIFSTRLQIEKAIEDQADYVVIGLTCSDRFDMAIDLDHYTVQYTLDNVLYHGYRAASEQHVDQNNVKLVSDTFNNIQARLYQKDLVTDQQLSALKRYIADLHNPSLARQKDYYIVCDGIRKLQSAGIEFVLIPGWMGQYDWSWVQRVWPKDRPMPYQMPYGPDNWETPIRFTNTHNPAWAHEEFAQTLRSITTDWNNG